MSDTTRRANARSHKPIHPVDNTKHDVLVLTSAKDLYRARRHPDKLDEQGDDGRDPQAFVTGLEKVGRDDDGHRKVTRIATSQRSSAGFVLLPIKPEPASGAFSCYLVNSSFFLDASPRELPPVTIDHIEGQRWELAAKRATKLAPAQGRQRGVEVDEATRAPRLQAALRRDEQLGYQIDANQVDFINPWTRVDWVSAEQDPEQDYSSALDSDPDKSQLLLRLVDQGAVYRAPLGLCDDQEAVPLELYAKPGDKLAVWMEAQGAILGTAWDDRDDRNQSGRWLPFVDMSALGRTATARTLLLAFANGSLRKVRLHDLTLTVEELAPRALPEAWRLLRNGAVIAETKLDDGSKALLLNLCSLKGGSTPTQVEMDTKIAGTLDLKWTPGTTLEVAFQADAQQGGVALARERIEGAFQTWLAGANLNVSFWPKDAVVYPTPGAQSDPTSTSFYDILINLDTLPQYVPPTTSDPERYIDFPVSEHGAYALRRRLGAPTMYLGWLPEFVAHAGAPRYVDASEYFASKVFLHFALHEVGHALGLPHLNQAPAFRLSALLPTPPSVDAVHTFLRDNHGVKVSKSFIDEELTRAWRFVDDPRFSEWPDELAVTPAEQRALLRSSIMVAFPVLGVLEELAKRPDGKTVHIDYMAQPSAFDLAWIDKLYPRPPAAQQ
jgi:hypothetical protein